MSGLTNDYLDKLSTSLIGSQFLGVYPADAKVKWPVNKSFFIIFNTGKIGTEGIHFVSLFVTKTRIHYFDSFGKRNIQTDISKFIQKIKRKCEMYCQPIQHKTSNFCGFYALAFLLWKKSKSRRNFYDMFSKTRLKLNDKIVIDFILKEIK